MRAAGMVLVVRYIRQVVYICALVHNKLEPVDLHYAVVCKVLPFVIRTTTPTVIKTS